MKVSRGNALCECEVISKVREYLELEIPYVLNPRLVGPVITLKRLLKSYPEIGAQNLLVVVP